MNKILKHIALAASCATLLVGCEKYGDLIPAEYHNVALIRESGNQDVTLYTEVGEQGKFEYVVMKSGSEPDAVATVQTEILTLEQLKEIGFTSIKLFPENLYTVDQTSFNLDGNNRYAKGTITFKNDEVEAFLKTIDINERDNYKVPLRIKSSNATINEEKSYFLLRPRLLKPTINYEVAAKEITVGATGTEYDFFLQLPFASPWDFECTVVSSTGANLPADAYTIENEGKVTFAKGERRSKALKIKIKGELLGKYTLPLKISNITKAGITLPTDDFRLTAFINKFPLTASMLSTNAQEPSEGAIANLLDGNLGTYFHSAWSVAVPGTHNFMVTLSSEKTEFAFSYNNRQHPNGKAKVIKILGSNDDGATWFDITTINSGLPTANGGGYDSAVIQSPKAFKKLRFDVTETQAGTKYFCMSEFALYAK
nr:DUF1735 domain-containing protein [uncultured Capnocytophaga sp.]